MLAILDGLFVSNTFETVGSEKTPGYVWLVIQAAVGKLFERHLGRDRGQVKVVRVRVVRHRDRADRRGLRFEGQVDLVRGPGADRLGHTPRQHWHNDVGELFKGEGTKSRRRMPAAPARRLWRCSANSLWARSSV